jgi:homogentisate 1,2-dioxygenase
MALILKRGRLPATPHTEFYAIPGVLALEEIHGSYGFSGAYARKMHLRSYPTEQVKAPKKADFRLSPKRAGEAAVLQPYHIRTGRMPYGGDFARSRKTIVFGPATSLAVAKPAKDLPKGQFFRNGERHELYYLQEGRATFRSEYGEVPLLPGRYLVVPKGTTYRIDVDGKAFFLVVESLYPIHFAPHYLNEQGQAKMTAPVVETEIVEPQFKAPVDERGEFAVFVKHGGGLVTKLTMGHHPFDLAGWEGALYPFGFDILNHHGIAREIHTAPPMHQTFESGKAPFSGFSLCSFIPQMEGWHPKEVPAPYAHYNVDSDECMFFSNASYGARKGVIEDGSFTFHPGSVPHSPQGRAALRSLAARGKMNKRVAVMLDTFFESLEVTAEGWRWRDPGYPLSWAHPAKEAEAVSPSE